MWTDNLALSALLPRRFGDWNPSRWLHHPRMLTACQIAARLGCSIASYHGPIRAGCVWARCAIGVYWLFLTFAGGRRAHGLRRPTKPHPWCHLLTACNCWTSFHASPRSTLNGEPQEPTLRLPQSRSDPMENFLKVRALSPHIDSKVRRLGDFGFVIGDARAHFLSLNRGMKHLQTVSLINSSELLWVQEFLHFWLGARGCYKIKSKGTYG